MGKIKKQISAISKREKFNNPITRLFTSLSSYKDHQISSKLLIVCSIECSGWPDGSIRSSFPKWPIILNRIYSVNFKESLRRNYSSELTQNISFCRRLRRVEMGKTGWQRIRILNHSDGFWFRNDSSHCLVSKCKLWLEIRECDVTDTRAGNESYLSKCHSRPWWRD